MRRAIPLLIAAATSACAASTVSEPRTAKAESQLKRELAGKVVDGKVSCLPSYRAGDMVIVDDNTILFRDGRSTIYRNDPPGGCSPIGRGYYTLVTKSVGGSGLCRGDIARVVDLTAKATVGSCALGDFVRYRTASR